MFIKNTNVVNALKTEGAGDIMNKTRSGCKDIWNAFMAEGAKFGHNDIPFCPTTAEEMPRDIVTWEEAKTIYKKQIASGNTDFLYDAYVCFYIDDYKFDGARGIWHDYNHLLKVLRHFSGAITPDFSTYQDFPEPIKIYATYRMRLMGYWLGKNGIPVINNVRWGTAETYRYCFEGIPHNDIVAIGTVGGSPRKHTDRIRFEEGLAEMMSVLCPHTIIIYGSANYSCLKKLEERGVIILAYPSKTNKVFTGRAKK